MIKQLISLLFWTFTFYAEGDGGGEGAATGGEGGEGAGAGAGGEGGGGDGAAAATDWTANLSEDMRGYVQNKGFKQPEDVLNSYVNLEKLHGVPAEQIVKLPGDNDDPESWNNVWSKLGKPDSPDGYEVPMPEEGGDENFAAEAKNWFHEANLTPAQAKKVAEKWNEYVTSTQQQTAEQQQQQAQEAEKTLKKEWGKAHDENIQVAQKAAREFGVTADQIDALEKTMGYDGVMKFMHSIGSKLGEDGYVASGPGGNNSFTGAMTPEQAKSRIATLRQDSGFVDRYTKGDTEARKEMARLHEMAYPSEE